MMHAKGFYFLASAFAILYWMPTGVLGVAIGSSEIQSRQVPTLGQVIINLLL